MNADPAWPLTSSATLNVSLVVFIFPLIRTLRLTNQGQDMTSPFFLLERQKSTESGEEHSCWEEGGQAESGASSFDEEPWEM